MSVLQRVVKPTTRKGKKVLISREPQLIETPKKSLFFNGRRTSEKVRDILNDLYNLKKPDVFKLSRKNDITIFENVAPVEQFCKKYEAAMFIMGSHSKKRPDNVVLGRMFDYSLLDMIELGIEDFDPMKAFSCSKITLGCKPMLVFNGNAWEQTPELKQLKSIFVDFFHREHAENIRLQGLEHAISFTVTNENKILFRSYKVFLKKSGCPTPRIEIEEIGPRIDFVLRRSKLPSEDLQKQACRKPKELKVIRKKNVNTDGLGTLHGRIHLGKQDISKLATRRMKGLRRTRSEFEAIKNKKTAIATNIEESEPGLKKTKLNASG